MARYIQYAGEVIKQYESGTREQLLGFDDLEAPDRAEKVADAINEVVELETEPLHKRIAELEAMLKQHTNIEFIDSRLHKIAMEEVSKIPTARYIDRLREYRRVTGCSLETAKLAIYKR